MPVAALPAACREGRYELKDKIGMWYFYVLESKKSQQWYKGYTDNLKRRFEEHNKKRGGKFSRKHAPFKLIYYEAYLNKKDAMKAETFFKTGYGREILKDKLISYLGQK